MRQRISAMVLAATIVAGVATAQGTGGSGWTLIGWNDLGMHCMDADYSVFSILPPYNTIHAQLVDPSGNLVTDPSGISVTYEAIADPDGSINTSSVGKTGFWTWVGDLFGVSPAPDQGLAGFDMPGATNEPQEMHFDTGFDWFTGEGIPLTPYDDDGGKNFYPMMRLVARDSSGQVLATTRIVLPVSDEMTCSSCHGSGSGPAAMPSGGWVYDVDPERDYRLNILLLHDDAELGRPAFDAALAAAGYNALGLYATVTSDGQPILCETCHGSNALPGTGMDGVPPLTQAVHGRHAGAVDPSSGMTLGESANRSACYSCHPGSETRCLRGAMGSAVAANGDLAIQCQSCHGGMSRVGSPDRAGWFDEPTCQSCHTGTATQNNGRIRYSTVFDDFGGERQAVDSTFATDPNTPAAGVSLYRFSTGHGGLQCEACHGSTHAVYPSSHLNDNLQNLDLQGHVGALSDCDVCHGGQPSTTNGGPHGMHPVGQRWVDRHGDAAEHNSGQCRTCHGADYRGTELSRALGDRVVSSEFGTRNFWRGFQIGCYTCHRGPSSESRNSNRAPVVSAVHASTGAGELVQVPLVASDADGDSLTLRIVSQPANGTVGLSGTLATYFPFAGFSGVDTFTYAAWDGSINSNLGAATVEVAGGGGVCGVSCTASVPPFGTAGDPIAFTADAVLSSCQDPPTFAWNFGDGSEASSAEVIHTYNAEGTYAWTVVVSSGDTTCTRSGSIEVGPAAGDGQCQLTCHAEVPVAAVVARGVELHGAADSEHCGGSASFEWSFGDGSASATGQHVEHSWHEVGTFNWSLRVTQGDGQCETEGAILIRDAEGSHHLSGRRRPD